MKDTIDWQVKVNGALASKPRLYILRLLREHPQCVNALSERLGLSQPAVSQHLRVLKQAGLVNAERRGAWIHYTINQETLDKYGKVMADVFGGWVELAKPVDGKYGCPSGVLKECQGTKTARRSGKERKK